MFHFLFIIKNEDLKIGIEAQSQFSKVLHKGIKITLYQGYEFCVTEV